MLVNRETFRFPAFPRMLFGNLVILPKVDRDNKVALGQWVLPGRKVVSTIQARQLAMRNDLYFHILEGSK